MESEKDESLCALLTLLAQQQRQVSRISQLTDCVMEAHAALAQDHNRLVEQIELVCRHLEKRGFMDAAQLHLEAALQRCECLGLFQLLLQEPCLAGHVLQGAGASGTCCFGACSRSSQLAALLAWTDVLAAEAAAGTRMDGEVPKAGGADDAAAPKPAGPGEPGAPGFLALLQEDVPPLLLRRLLGAKAARCLSAASRGCGVAVPEPRCILASEPEKAVAAVRPAVEVVQDAPEPAVVKPAAVRALPRKVDRGETVYACAGYDGQAPVKGAAAFAPALALELPPVEPAVVKPAAVKAPPRKIDGGERIYICGGYDGQAPVKGAAAFDVGSRSWQRLPPMSVPRCMASAVRLGEHVYVCGGRHRRPLETAERFDPAVNAWQRLPAMRQRRLSAVTLVLGKYLYVCGGRSEGTSGSLAAVERFDPARGAWQDMPGMAKSRFNASGTAGEDRLYVCGGIRLSGRALKPTLLTNMESLRPGDAAWQALPSFSLARCDQATASCGTALYLCGGTDGAQPLDSVECFDLQSEEWHLLPPMAVRRASCAAAIGEGDRLFVCGGHTGCGTTASVECYDPAMPNCWEQLEDMAFSRASMAAVLVGKELFIFGGHTDVETAVGGGRCIGPAPECYDLERRCWSLLPPMPARLTELQSSVAVL